MNKNLILTFVKSIVTAYIISFVLLAVLAALLFFMDAPEGIVRGGVIVVYVLSCFVAGMILSRNRGGRCFLWGIFAGAVYCLILFVVSLVCGKIAFSGVTGVFPTVFLCVCGGMLGGMMQAGRK